jgi:hypothetical protein
MRTMKTLLTLALLSAFGLAACSGDGDTAAAPDGAEVQPGAAAPQDDFDPAAMELMVEAQEIQQRLQPIQQQAMEDEELSRQLQAVQQQVEAAMREESPDLFQRMEELEAEFMVAQEAGDQERAQELGMEAQGVEMELQNVQQSVLDRPDIREPVEAFEEAQRERMLEIDPEAADLLDRMDEILAELGLR